MIKRITTYFLFLFIPFLSFSQWTKLGNDIIGAEGDKIGTLHSIAIDAAGETVAIGSPFNSDNGAFSGIAKVYDWDGTEWILRSTIKGILPDTEGTGDAVDLSADGKTLALGISYGLNALGLRCGIVKVSDWDGTEWILRGAVIDGEGNSSSSFTTDIFGSALSLSADGNFIVVGASGNTPEVGVLQISGHARVYQWDGNQWAQMGEEINGETGLEQFGNSVSINDAGNVVAIAGKARNLINPDSSVIQSAGYVRIFEWDGTDWEQRGDAFFGTGLGERLGNSISLSSDGNTVAIGAPNSASTTVPGSAKIFDWNGTNWVQRGQDIVGDLSGHTGSSVDLSSDGNIIAVGEPWANSVYGQVRVFSWNNNNWEQIDNAIADAGPSNSINAVGNSVAINSDGSITAVGASGFDTGSFTDEGLVNIFKNQSLVNVDDIDISEISYYPNPTTDNLLIQSSNEMENVEVFTITGQKINSINVNDKELDLDMRNLPSGSYFVKIQSLGKIQTIKVVKIW